MKKNIAVILLVTLMVFITGFLTYIIISKQHVNSKNDFNIQEGEVIKFDEYDIEATVLNIASTLCDKKDTCISEGEVEMSVRVKYNDNISNYTLKSKNNPEERIVKNNYFIKLNYENKKLELSIREK